MKIINSISKVSGYVVMGSMFIMMMLNVLDVLLRFVFRNPISGVFEISEILMVTMLLAMAWCAIEGRHIKIDYFLNYFSKKVQAVVDVMTLFLSLSITAIIAWQGYIACMYARKFYITYSFLKIQEFPFIFILVLSFTILCLAIVVLIIQRCVVIKK